MSDPGPTRHSRALVACARWEERDVLEWLAYHRSIGFDHVFLYCNDDDPAAMLRLLTPHLFGPRPFVTLRHWPVAGRRAEAFLHFLTAFKDRTDWFAFLDLDEFLVVKDGDDVARFMRRFEDAADCVVFHSIEYGAGGRTRRDDGFILTSRLRRAAEPDPRTRMICRAQAVDAAAVAEGWRLGAGPFWQSWDGYGLDGMRCVGALGQPVHVAPAGTQPEAAAPQGAIDVAYVAHFRFKAESDFQRRWERDGTPESARWRAMRDAGEHRAVLERSEAVYDTYLAEYWHGRTATALDVMLRVPPEAFPAPNVALNKPSWQSSIYEPTGPEPPGSRLVGGANDGVRSGSYGFHTRLDDGPWWAVDLLGAFRILGVRVYNRTDHPSVAARSNEIDVLVSMDASTWTVVYSRAEREPFGGVGFAPLEAAFKDPPLARMIALRLRGRNFLHLDEVEAYGLPA